MRARYGAGVHPVSGGPDGRSWDTGPRSAPSGAAAGTRRAVGAAVGRRAVEDRRRRPSVSRWARRGVPLGRVAGRRWDSMPVLFAG